MINEKMNEINLIINTYKELAKISHALHKLDEAACNYGLTERQDKNEEKLMQKANEIAQKINLFAYHQGDPRGCSLYLVENQDAYNNYTNGIAIF